MLEKREPWSVSDAGRFIVGPLSGAPTPRVNIRSSFFTVRIFASSPSALCGSEHRRPPFKRLLCFRSYYHHCGADAPARDGAAWSCGRDPDEPAVILTDRVPGRPSRLKLISMPSARRKVCARRSRPASARGFFGHPALAALCPGIIRPRTSVLICRKSDAVPTQSGCCAMSSRTHRATISTVCRRPIATPPRDRRYGRHRRALRSWRQ